MNISELSLKPYLYIGVAALCFGAGFLTARHHYLLEIENFKLEIQNQSLQAELINKDKSLDLQSGVSDVQSSLSQKIFELNNQYINLPSLSDFAPVVGGVFNQSDSDKNSMPDHAAATVGVQKGGCKCDADDLRQLQDLYSREVQKAKRCDEITLKYNSLIDLYNKVQANFNE